jgi:hypothetical protein
MRALKGEPHERRDAHGREHRQVDRGGRRKTRKNAGGAMSRGWQPGAGTASRASALGRATGRFDRPEYVEGERNPMRGGGASGADATAAAGHALKRMVSEESWKNRRATVSRTHEAHGAARKLWTSA